ncbi:MAG TPA: hypothetical protein VFX59_00130 [Polyangiales bacterium]|nr:hypothetical protein [Polyangiales bacterium]
MQQDVRRSDPTDTPARAEPEPAEKPGFARSLFRFAGKRKKAAAEPARLTDRLKEVLERDRALIASEPPVALEEEAWPDPFGQADPEPHTGTRPTAAWDGALDEPFESPLARGETVRFDVPAATGTRASERGRLQLTEARESADLRLSQIASWIEEEINELPEGAGSLALEAPLDEHEAAELDAVLSESDASRLETVLPPEGPDATIITDNAAMQAALAAPEEARAPSSRAQVKAKVSARPAPREDAGSRGEPINTLTMARLLAMQGYKPRALAVYRQLLKRSPDDETLRAEFEALQASEP